MRNKIICFLAIILLFSCSPEKKLSRLLKKYPELIKRDTFYKIDTTIINGTKTDTSFYFYQSDTITIKKDQLTIKYYFRKDSTIYISGKCDTIRIIKEIPVIVNAVETKNISKSQKIKLFFVDNFAWIALTAIIVFYIFRHKNNNG